MKFATDEPKTQWLREGTRLGGGEPPRLDLRTTKKREVITKFATMT